MIGRSAARFLAFEARELLARQRFAPPIRAATRRALYRRALITLMLKKDTIIMTLNASCYLFASRCYILAAPDIFTQADILLKSRSRGLCALRLIF